MKMIPPLNADTKGTFFHFTQLCLLCKFLLFQLHKKTLQFLGSLGYYNRLCISIRLHRNSILLQSYYFQTITQTILQKSYYFTYSNPSPQNSTQSFSGHRPHRNIYGTPDLWQESPYQSYTQSWTLFQVLSHIHHNNVSGISVSHIRVHALSYACWYNIIEIQRRFLIFA